MEQNFHCKEREDANSLAGPLGKTAGTLGANFNCKPVGTDSLMLAERAAQQDV